MSATSAASSRPPPALRHDGAAVRERPVPHRPHHGVHPGRHLGALPADAGPRGAFRLRRRHARRADHAEGRGRGHHAAGAGRAASRRRARSTSTASTSASTTGTRRTRRRTSSCRRTSTARCEAAASIVTTKPVEQFYDPVKAMFLPDRYIKGECPKCGAKDQYGDACENCGVDLRADRPQEPVLDAVRARRPVLQVVRALLLPALGPACVAFLRRWTQHARAALQPEVANKVLRVAGRRRRGRQGSPTGTSRATRRTSASRFPDAPGKYFYVWLDAPVGYLASLKALPRGKQRRSTSTQFLQSPDVEQYPLHRQGHRLLPHAVLAGDAEVRRRAVQGAGQRVRARLHHGVRREDVEVARHRRQPATSTSTSASTPSGCATTSPRSSTPRSRTSTSIPTTSSRGSTAT